MPQQMIAGAVTEASSPFNLNPMTDAGAGIAQRQAEIPQFRLEQRAFNEIRGAAEAAAGKALSKLLENPKEFLESVWKALNSRGQHRFGVKSVDLLDRFTLGDVGAGSRIREGPPFGTSQSTEVAEITAELENGKSFRGKDGRYYTVIQSGDGRGLTLFENFIRYDKSSGSDFRFPNEVFQNHMGNCAEISALAASFMQEAGFKGSVSILQVEYSDSSTAHAFLISPQARKSHLYWMDFTVGPAFKEMEYQPGKDDRAGWEGLLRSKTGLELLGHSGVQRVREYRGFGAIAGFCYEKMAAKLLDAVAATTPMLSHLDDEAWAQVAYLEKIVDSGLESDERNAKLYSIRSDLKTLWLIPYLDRYGETKATERMEGALSDIEKAVGLDPHNPELRYKFASSLNPERLDAAYEQIEEAIRLDPTNLRYINLRKEIEEKLKR